MRIKQNDILILAGGLVIALFIMGMVLYTRSDKRSQKEIIYENVTSQSQSTEIESIEKDLMDTELEEIDKELQQIDKELESAY